MNTLKILVIAAIFSFTLLSCNNDDPNPSKIPVGYNVDPPIAINGRFLLSKDGEGDRIEQDIHMEGQGEMNAFGQANLTLDHYEIFDFNEQIVYLNEGSFRLWNENGTELHGQYTGTTDTPDKYLIVQATINGGTGEFKDSYGSITLELIDQGNSEYLAWVNGMLRIRKVVNPPS